MYSMKILLNNLYMKCSEYIKSFIDGLSVQVKLIISIVFGVSVFITLSAFVIIHNIQSNIDNQVLMLNNNLKSTQILSNIASQALIKNYGGVANRKTRLEELINGFIKEHSEITFAIFTDNVGTVLAKSRFADLYEINKENKNFIPPPKHVPYIQVYYSNSGKLLIIAEPIQYNSNFFGWVWVGIPDTGFTIVGSRKELIVFLLEIFILVWILSIIGAIVNSLIITRPLRKLEKGAKAITEGRFGFQLPLKGFLGKELTQLVKAFNKMSKRLQQYEESNIATLSSERNKFESVVMSITDGVIVLDKEDIIQIINPAALRLLNRSYDELIGHKITNLWTAKINDQVFSYLNSLKLDGSNSYNESSSFEFMQDNKSLKLYITPLYFSNNDKLGAVLVIHDRTKEVEVELIKQEFISNVSHELRTPITSIKCYVDTLCSHNSEIDEKTRVEFISIINQETDRLSNLVNDVLELSRLDSHTRKLQLTLQEIYPCLEYTLKSISVLAEKKFIRLISDIEEDLPLLNINQENIERVFINLLSNAIKYTPGNGMVKMKVNRDGNNVKFQIIDNGIGIQEEHLPMIFERFYRVENKVHTIKGTGLGLTIVKKSIEQHGGQITVKSKFGEGSVFEFTLPIPNEQLTKNNNVEDFKTELPISKTA